MIICRIGSWLDHEYVLAAHVFVNLDKHLHVGKATHARLGERQVEVVRYGLGERPIAVAGEDLHRQAAAVRAAGYDPAASSLRNVTTRRRDGNSADRDYRPVAAPNATCDDFTL